MATLLITKLAAEEYSFVVNGDTANEIVNMRNDLTVVGNKCHFKTSNGANLIKEQNITYSDVTLETGTTYTFTSVYQLFTTLRAVGFFDWIDSIGGGGTGTDRFDELLDTFTYFGKDGQGLRVNESELKLETYTVYNYQNLTQLADTFDTIIPNKMLVTNATGDKVVLADLPETPETYLNSVGTFHYADDATNTTPLVLVSDIPTLLTNDANGEYTALTNAPYGVSSVWDSSLNQFDFSQLSIGDTLDLRIDIKITTTTANQRVLLDATFGAGSTKEFSLNIANRLIKSAVTDIETVFNVPFDLAYEEIRDYPTKLHVTSDASGSIKVSGWYISIIRKNINVVDVLFPTSTRQDIDFGSVASSVVDTLNTQLPNILIQDQNVGQIRIIGTFIGVYHEYLFTGGKGEYGTGGLQSTTEDFLELGSTGGGVESVTGTAVDNTDPLNPVINSTGGAVDSVNGQTGVVVLDTGDIAEVTDKKYVTDAQLVVIGNTSGTNTGDNATNTQYSGLAASKADKGVRITNATTTGSYAVDWSAADVWQLTLTGATTITDSNLPTGTATKVIELVVKGAFGITLPAYWEATPASGTYDGSKWNHFVISCIVGTTSSEKVIYSNEVLAT